jgi:lipoprotein-releasing system permease protein
MKFEWFVALRYFRSSRKKASFLSFIKIMAITGVAIGSAGLLISLSIVHGFKSVIEDKILGFGTHITIETYSEMPLYRADTLVTMLQGIPEIDDVQAVIYGQGMIQAGPNVEGTFIKGVPPTGDLSDLRNYIIEGTYDLGTQTNGYPGIIIGSRLARNLRATVGQNIFVYAIRGIPSASNIPEIQQFVLTGVYNTGMEQFDDVFALVPINSSRRLFNMVYPTASQIDARLISGSDIVSVGDELAETIDFPYYTLTIYQKYRNLFAWINLQEQTIPLVIGVMIIVAAFNLIGTVLMMVLERIRDIGILKMIGTSDKKVRNIFLIEGFFVGFVGLSIGITIAVLFNVLQSQFGFIPLAEENYYMSTVPIEPHLVDFVLVAVITMVLCVLASYIPARVASKVRPLKVTAFGK